jgi:hypothetical protein
MKKRCPTTKGSLVTMSWAELRPEAAWLKLMPGSMRKRRADWRTRQVWLRRSGEVEAFIHNELV